MNVLEAGSFTLTSERLELSRAAVSKYVSELENQLGFCGRWGCLRANLRDRAARLGGVGSRRPRGWRGGPGQLYCNARGAVPAGNFQGRVSSDARVSDVPNSGSYGVGLASERRWQGERVVEQKDVYTMYKHTSSSQTMNTADKVCLRHFQGRRLWFLYLFLVFSSFPTVSVGWEAQTDYGQDIWIDPATNRATIRSGVGAGRPLWDGVHRLEQGSTITIRSGVVVPTEQMETPAPVPSTLPESFAKAHPPAGPMPHHDPTCDELVLRSCGLSDECRSRTSCRLAKQLQAQYRKAGWSDPEGRDWAIKQCRQALQDETNFVTCASAAQAMAAPCAHLAQRVCGDQYRCYGSSACQMALRLQQIEYEQASTAQKGPGPHAQCLQMLLQHAAFPPCR